MNKLIIALSLLALCATGVGAGVIYDCQTGVYPEWTHVDITGAVVTATDYFGVFINESDNGPHTGIWLYLGENWYDTWPLVPGSQVDVGGYYIEYYEFSEITLPDDAGGYCTITGSAPVPDPIPVSLAEMNVDPEPYECCLIRVTDGLAVYDLLDYSQWMAESVESPGEVLMLLGNWYDFATVSVGDCYNWVTGILVWGYGNYKIEPFAGDAGIDLTDCAVANETMSFGSIKSLYR